jgi:hypothetical protein
MPRPLFTSGKDPVPIVQKAGWAPGPVWTGAENLAPTEIRSPDRPARSQSLYRLRYPAPRVFLKITLNRECFTTVTRMKYCWSQKLLKELREYNDTVHTE